jgi:uncharacterized protein
MKIAEAAQTFLDTKRIAVTGVSRTPAGHGGNAVFDRLVDRGYEVFAINPNAETIGEHPAYPNLAAVPGGVEAVVIATRPEHALGTVTEAAELGIKQVWMHRSMDAGSVAPEAVTYGREHGLTVIDGGCPLMFGTASDGFHKVMCAVMKVTGQVPRTV